MYRDGDWEIEDCVAVANGWTACLCGASRRGQDLGLKLEELSHEAEVGRDDAAALLDELEGFVQLHAVGPHEVGEADRGGAGDACLTVHKDTASFIPHRVWGERDEKVTLVHCVEHVSADKLYVQRVQLKTLKLCLSQEVKKKTKNTELCNTFSCYLNSIALIKTQEHS